MSEWVIEPAPGPRDFPRVRHRHHNGTLDAVRDRTPTQVQPLGQPVVERWTYWCACGEGRTLERQRSA